MLDLEEQVGRVWNPEVRPLVAEAYRCYATGAARACITLTWVAVCADLIEKVNRLAEDGEATAADLVTRIETARHGGTNARAVQTMQDIERTILDKVAELELIDSIGRRELERLREDRHLCAHPSLRPLGEFYEPRIEYARAHLAVALEVLLTHPPSQGRKVIDRFREHLVDPSFTGSSDYLAHAFFDRVKTATRRRTVDLAVKHAVLELDGPDPPGAVTLANRMAICVQAFANQDRDIVRDAMKKAVERLRDLPGEIQLRTIGRLGDLDVFWDTVDAPTRSRFEGLIESIPLPGLFDTLGQDHAAVLSLVAIDEIRHQVPALEAKISKLSAYDRTIVIAKRPGLYFAPFVPQLLEGVRGFRAAEFITQQAVIPCGPFLTKDQLRETLTHWATNDQCRVAGGMLGFSLDFYAATRHLLPGAKSIWQDFIAAVQSKEPPGSSYCYTQLEAIVNGVDVEGSGKGT